MIAVCVFDQGSCVLSLLLHTLVLELFAALSPRLTALNLPPSESNPSFCYATLIDIAPIPSALSPSEMLLYRADGKKNVLQV